MTVSWSRAQEVAGLVLALAAECGLVCFDPQASVVHNPPGQPPVGGLRLEFCDGGVVERPEPAVLGTLLQAISPRNWYACLESRPGWFVQVGIGPNAGSIPSGMFALEYREGSPERHQRTLVASLDEVVTAFEGFASGDPVWKDAFSWSRDRWACRAGRNLAVAGLTLSPSASGPAFVLGFGAFRPTWDG
jgi:hypothetical protein